MDPTFSSNLNTTLGVMQISVLISCVLFGVMTTQTYIYYSRFPGDSYKLKTFVAFIWVCEIAHVLCSGHTLYIYTILDYGHPERISGVLPKSGAVTLLLQGVVELCVQGFFSFRIYTLSKKLYIPILSWGFSLWRLGGGAVLFITALRMTSFPDEIKPVGMAGGYELDY
ncbi:hypothetical protein MVEN_00611400 [Mycena venus]|uniref:Uncharacterized protein n=1 Tax=Mycena venus TaxID=2733690 RepID=A0A8H6YP62_9AGAR|nr:hypothetical protein MVEN_00611400 [Mycena venus]